MYKSALNRSKSKYEIFQYDFNALNKNIPISIQRPRRIELDPSGDAKVHVRNPEISHEVPVGFPDFVGFSVDFIGFRGL